MQEININSKEIKYFSGHSLKNNYITIEEGNNIYFTKSLVLLCDLKPGEYIHFLNEDSDWKFYSNDCRDGFKLCKGNSKPGFFLTNNALVRMILKSTGYYNKKIFYVKKTRMMHDNCDVFQLNPNQ